MSTSRVRVETIANSTSSHSKLAEPQAFRRFEPNHIGNAFANLAPATTAADPACESAIFRRAKGNSGAAGYHYRGMQFASVSEAAIGILLEQLVDGFQLRIGETFQVRTSSGHVIDFMVRELLVEFHHLRFYREGNHFGDFASAAEFQQYQRRLHRTKARSAWREQIIEETRQRLEENYFLRRRQLLDQDPALRECELVVATNPRDLCTRVLQRYGSQQLDEAQFEQLFKQQVRTLLRSCAAVEKAARRCAKKSM